MCTAIKYKRIFGRNFDLDREFEQRILLTPRNYIIKRRNAEDITEHYALMGMGLCIDNFPLYYDAMNEHGLAMAGLNFPVYAKYNKNNETKENVATFELIPTLLGKCRNVAQAVEYSQKINITGISFSDKYRVTPLHWMIADRECSAILECDERGTRVYTGNADILTNSPSYDIQMFNLSNYMSISPKAPENRFSKKLPLSPCSFGMGGIGLPGDLSSMSRFVRSSFLLHNSPRLGSREEEISHFFRLLYAVAMTKGAVQTDDGKIEYTQYSCSMELDRMIYRYTSYSDLKERVFSLFDYDINGKELLRIN